MDADQKTHFKDSDLELPPPPLPKPSPRFERWQALIEIAPELRKLQRSGPREVPPPNQLSDHLFLAFCASLVSPQRREILRALLFDLLQDDVIELLIDPNSEGTQ